MPAPSEPTRRWLISDAVALPAPSPEDGLELVGAGVALEGDRIVEVCRGADRAAAAAREAGQPARRFDGCLITPAFVNAHTHLAMACFRGVSIEEATGANVVEDLFFELEARMSPGDIAAFARLGAYESLLSGVGLVWEHYYGGEALAEAIASTGLGAVVAPTLQDLEGPGASGWEAQLEATAALTGPGWSARGIWAALGPHATDTVSAELWARALTLARAHELPVHVHVAQSLEEVERSHARHGRSPIAQLDELGVLDADEGPAHLTLIHAIFASRGDLTRLDPRRHTLGFCPYSQLIFGFPAAAPTWEELGLSWFVATDAAASNDSMNVQKELRYVAGLRTSAASASAEYQRFLARGGLEPARRVGQRRRALHTERAALADPQRLLARVWSIPGRMHPGVRVGQIAPGALANLAVWDLDHPSMWPGTRPLRTLAMGDTTGALYNLMCQGRWVGADGDYHRSLLHMQGYREARQEASQRLEALLARL